jgi:hypothetical protein
MRESSKKYRTLHRVTHKKILIPPILKLKGYHLGFPCGIVAPYLLAMNFYYFSSPV